MPDNTQIVTKKIKPGTFSNTVLKIEKKGCVTHFKTNDFVLFSKLAKLRAHSFQMIGHVLLSTNLDTFQSHLPS